MGLLLGKLPLSGQLTFFHPDSHALLPDALCSIDDDDKPSNLASNLGLLYSASLLQHDAE
jgi:hypothetical protein